MRKKFLAFLLPVILCAIFTMGGTVAYASGATTVSETADVFELLVSPNQLDLSKTENKNYKAFNDNNWEPGFVRYERFQMVKGSEKDISYKLTMELEPAIGVSGARLADVMDVYVFPYDETPSRADLNVNNYVGSITGIVNNEGVLYEGDTKSVDLASGETVFDIVVAIKMRESAGNAYQGLELCENDNQFTLKLSAWQSATS